MINKDKNILVQITLNKQTATKLNFVIDDLSNKLALNLSKSQAIAILINNYGKDQTAKAKESKPNNKQRINNVNYQSVVKMLKDKLNVSYPHLAEILNIPTSTLKKYAYGEQEPNGENAEKLNKALTRYGIK